MNTFAAAPANRTARLRSLRRAVVLSAATLAMVGLSACGEGRNAPAGSPAPTTSDAPATVATAAPVSNPASATVLTGTRYYLGMTDQEAVVHAVRGNVDEVTARIPLGKGSCVRNTITISPYGERLAWVEGGANEDAGTLVTSTIDGSRKRTVERAEPFRGKANCIGSNPLVWNTNDLLMVQDGRRSVLIDVAENKPADGDAGNETLKWWSADGRNWAAVSEGKPYATGGSKVHFYHYTPPKAEAAHYDGWRVRSVSMDGRYVAVGWMNTDVSRNDGSFAVVDTTTSKVVKLPVGGEVKSIQFAADGKVLVRQATRVVVLDARFRQIGEVAEPRDVQQLTLLTYVP
ncbi:hypothetical protein ONA91_04910 [Micromonospora sp. DR5-3]|uniref:hypothetical protein n=1 Tax=unclassified Micromonospora TaxID=2617518 RepID=UPI0011D5CE30|nr:MULTISPECIES: hypothetical protein [unclassified Micromonospora]MCW3813796.1 hypothetical protein [Micromonospora sp. DR5-3]TYC25523.1 hypothetical protein FXF52_03590 [Micromonospora sp. MP36]